MVATKRLPVFPFSRPLKGCKGHKTHRFENGGTNQIRKTGRREVVLLRPSPQTLYVQEGREYDTSGTEGERKKDKERKRRERKSGEGETKREERESAREREERGGREKENCVSSPNNVYVARTRPCVYYG